MATGAWYINQLQTQVLEKEAQNRTELVLHFTQATQDYMTHSLRPAVEQITDNLPIEVLSANFATREVVEEFNLALPEYTYKPATINPTNPIDTANEFEVSIIEKFRQNTQLEKLTGYTTLDNQERFYSASPVQVFASCLRCHGDPKIAPKVMIQHYGSINGFGWKVGDIVGALMIYVPIADLRANFAATLNNLWLTFALLTLVVIMVIYFWFGQLVAHRLTRISGVMSQTAANPTSKLTLYDRTKDEIGLMVRSFNRMSEALYILYTQLEDKVRERTTQLTEANDQIKTLNHKLSAENSRMSSELEILQKMQAMILPKPAELSRIKDLDISGFMQPAEEIGGDYYDVLETERGVTIGIGDVTGHGLESGILMVMTQTAIRTLKESGEQDLIKFVDILNRTLYDNVQRMEADRDLTLSILNYEQGTLQITGQHEDIIVVRASGEIEQVSTVDLGIPIAFDQEIMPFLDRIFLELNPGDGMVLYTDGITETANRQQQPYGIERLCDVIHRYWNLSVEEIKEAILKDFYEFTDHQNLVDDITLLVIKRKEQN
jgi:serine phosphatase RsbU (regulator of sigma subunit)